MDRDKAVSLLKDVIGELDYDYYKDIFEYPENVEEYNRAIDTFIKIFEKHKVRFED